MTKECKKTKYLPKLNKASPENIYYFSTDTSWGISDPQKFSSLMNEAKKLVAHGFFLGDNLFTWCRNNSFLEDDSFRLAWEKNIQNTADQAIVWRRYILACAGYHCMQIPGDFVECGVYQGSGIKTVIDYLGGTNFEKTFWGYDTFDYNPVPGHTFEGQVPGFYEQVKKRFIDYSQVKLIKGFLPDSFVNNKPDKVAYLHIDLNNLEGELSVLENLFDLISPGGIIILDDYEWAGVYRLQKIGESMWFDQKGYRIFPLPTGQGIVLKR